MPSPAGFGASATVKTKMASGNNYTPTRYAACGVRLHQAASVKRRAGRCLTKSATGATQQGRRKGQADRVVAHEYRTKTGPAGRPAFSFAQFVGPPDRRTMDREQGDRVAGSKLA